MKKYNFFIKRLELKKYKFFIKRLEKLTKEKKFKNQSVRKSFWKLNQTNNYLKLKLKTKLFEINTYQVHTNWFPIVYKYLNNGSRFISLIQSIKKMQNTFNTRHPYTTTKFLFLCTFLRKEADISKFPRLKGFNQSADLSFHNWKERHHSKLMVSILPFVRLLYGAFWNPKF